MDAEYTLTEDDYFKLQEHANEVVPAMKWRYRLLRWVLPVGAVVYAIGLAATMPKDSSDRIEGVVFIGMALIFLIGAPKLFEFLERRMLRAQMRARQNSPFSGPVRVLLLPDEIHVTTSGSHNGYKWGAVLNITEIPTHYFFWLSQRDALIIPKRVFGTPEQEQAFGITARKYRAAYALPSSSTLPG
ncbi:MAG: hypothetical protein JWN14_4281 [Chthonomonadales bacterium]|nr:hypothetical protein [Chthonomonadales bacterium]